MLDEPSIGLHSRDTHRLIKILHDLRDLGNTILVVEHDPDVMRASDRILDLGPGAGENGGKVIAAGTYDEISESPGFPDRTLSLGRTADSVACGAPQARLAADQDLGARAHNLKNIDFAVPLGMLVAITGVSGRANQRCCTMCYFRPCPLPRGRANGEPLPSPDWSELEGDDLIDDVILVDQSPIGRTPRSNPVTYIKAFDGIRDLFASLPEAKKRGFSAGHFSSTSPEDAAKPARATAPSPSKCNFWPTSN